MDVREPPGAGTLVHHHPLFQCMRINHKLCPSCSWRSRGWQEGCAAAWGWVLHRDVPFQPGVGGWMLILVPGTFLQC